MKYYIIAGEASGDLHASSLVRELKKLDPAAEFRGWGGDMMEAQGVTLVRHFKEVAFMGFLEVLKNLGTILSAMKECKADIVQYRPDLLILVDYPGFNLRMAGFARKKSIPVAYYISPQVWAWKKSRVYKIRKTVDKMLVILPFEEEFYARYDFPVTFVGHPLLDVTRQASQYASRQAFARENGLSGKPLIALLPGSREQEISRMLPVMAAMSMHFPDHEFVVAAAPSQDITTYQKLLPEPRITILQGMTYEILRHADAALVTSGTATLETALFDVPQVVCYRGSKVSYLIARQLVDVKYISLVNLIMDREVVKELIQNDFNEKNLQAELAMILKPDHRDKILTDYQVLKLKLGKSGASAKAAFEIAGMIK